MTQVTQSYRASTAEVPSRRQRVVEGLRRTRDVAVLLVVLPAEFTSGLLATKPLRKSTQEALPALGIVLAAYDGERTRAALRRLVKPALGTILARQAVIVANCDAVMECLAGLELPSNVTIIRGSNAEAEFSAYDEGLEWMRSHGGVPETVLIANDRVLSYGDSYRHVLDPLVLETVRAYSMISGSIESYHRTVPFFDGSLQTWCRSNFLLTSREALDVICPITSVTREEFDRPVPGEFPGQGWPQQSGSVRNTVTS